MTGELHGMLANNVKVLRDAETGESFVEMHVTDSKTKLPRWVTMVAETSSGVKVLETLMDYFSISGLEMRRYSDGIYDILEPDYYVLKVSVFGMDRFELAAMSRALSGSKVEGARSLAAETLRTAARRLKVVGEEEKKFVNVWGGPASSRSFSILAGELTKEGVERERISTVAGPLIRGTCERGQVFTHTCFDPKSTLKDMKDIQMAAFLEMREVAGCDRELELEGRSVPYFVNHANRRLTDRVAMEAMRKEGSGLTSVDVDLYMGWRLKLHSVTMNLHYSGDTREGRRRRARLTSSL